MQKSEINKFRSFFATVFLIFAISSVFYTSLEANHNCCNDNCPVCQIINLTKQNLKLTLLVIAAATIVISHPNTATKINSNHVDSTEKIHSLINLKIRIND